MIKPSCIFYAESKPVHKITCFIVAIISAMSNIAWAAPHACLRQLSADDRAVLGETPEILDTALGAGIAEAQSLLDANRLDDAIELCKKITSDIFATVPYQRLAQDQQGAAIQVNSIIREALLRKAKDLSGETPHTNEKAFEVANQLIQAIWDASTCSETLYRQTDVFHSADTLEWVLKFKPEASIALKIAALAHDIERAFDDQTVDTADYDKTSSEYKRIKNIEHAKSCADFFMPYLRAANIDEQIIKNVERLIIYHEVGSKGFVYEPTGEVLLEPDKTSPFSEEVDVLKEADSVSFFAKAVRPYREVRGDEKALGQFVYKYKRVVKPEIRAMIDQHMEDLWKQEDPEIYAMFVKAKQEVEAAQPVEPTLNPTLEAV